MLISLIYQRVSVEIHQIDQTLRNENLRDLRSQIIQDREGKTPWLSSGPGTSLTISDYPSDGFQHVLVSGFNRNPSEKYESQLG